eukprot:1301679-Amphidinium_carterae.1
MMRGTYRYADGPGSAQWQVQWISTSPELSLHKACISDSPSGQSIPSCHSKILPSAETHPKLSFPKFTINGNPSQVVIPKICHQRHPIPSCHSKNLSHWQPIPSCHSCNVPRVAM